MVGGMFLYGCDHHSAHDACMAGWLAGELNSIDHLARALDLYTVDLASRLDFGPP